MNRRYDQRELPAIIAHIRDRFPVSEVATRAGVELRRAGNEWKGCCPFHLENTPSFTIYDDDRRFQCFGGGCDARGDVVDFVKLMYDVKTFEAIGMLDVGMLREVEQQRGPAKQKRDMRAIAERIVDGSRPIAGTPAELYLRFRGITIELPDTLRFGMLPPPKIDGNGVLTANGSGVLPALIGIVRNASGEFIGIQRTYLTHEGRKAASADGKVKYSLGNLSSGAIRLAPPAETVLVTEGLEDGLTLQQGLNRPVWVAAGTKMLAKMQFPPIVRAVVIGADGDEPGAIAARKAAKEYLAAGLEVRIMPPPAPWKDWNAHLTGDRA